MPFYERDFNGTDNSSNATQDQTLFDAGNTAKTLKKSKILFGILLSVLILIVLFPVICFGFLYFAYDTNVFAFVKEIKQLNKFSEASLNCTEKFYESDRISYINKVENGEGLHGAYLISDNEVAAYLSSGLDEDDSIVLKKNFQLNGTTDFEIVQIDFFDTYTVENPNHLTNLNVILKLNLDRFKQNEFLKFPINFISDYIPDSVYLSLTEEISINENGGYDLLFKSVRLNDLDLQDSQKLLN